MSPNHPAGSKLHFCHCCGPRHRQPLMPGGVDKAVLVCPACDPNLFSPNLSRKAKP